MLHGCFVFTGHAAFGVNDHNEIETNLIVYCNFKFVSILFKSEYFLLSCGSRQRDSTSSGWKFKLNNLAVKGLRAKRHLTSMISMISI